MSATETESLIPVVLCGGSGTRLWPLSREAFPKQFLPLQGEQTLLQQTVARMQSISAEGLRVQVPIIVCNQAHRFLVASQLQEMVPASQRLPATVLLEPEGRNTAPALTLAALHAQAGGEDPILLATPADHAMADAAAFMQAVNAALPLAQRGDVVTFGVTPNLPETAYGYIERGPHAAGADGQVAAYCIASFREKPDLETARSYLASGRFDWNSGLFMLRSSVWLQAIERHRKDILDACRAAMAKAVVDLDFIRPDVAAFTACPSESIDYAVMEHLPGDAELPASMVPLQAGWSDLGAWDAVWQALPRDEQGNAFVGDVLAQNCHDSLLLSSGRLVAGLGVRDMLVVETPDAVLVAHRDDAQGVKQLVEALRQQGRALADTHRKVHRPWGWYDRVDQGERFQVKRIVVNPGASISLQKHHHRAEHWVVVKGTAEVIRGEQRMLLAENESTFIPLGQVHRLANPGMVPLEIIEVQSGSYLGEDDIVRFDVPADYS